MLKMFLIRSRMVGFCLLVGVRAGIGLRGTKPVQLDKDCVLNSVKSDTAVATGLRSAVSPASGLCAICCSRSRKSLKSVFGYCSFSIALSSQEKYVKLRIGFVRVLQSTRKGKEAMLALSSAFELISYNISCWGDLSWARPRILLWFLYFFLGNGVLDHAIPTQYPRNIHAIPCTFFCIIPVQVLAPRRAKVYRPILFLPMVSISSELLERSKHRDLADVVSCF